MSQAEESTPTQGATQDNETVVPENKDTVVPDGDNDTVMSETPATRRTAPSDGTTAPSRTITVEEDGTEVDPNGKTCRGQTKKMPQSEEPTRTEYPGSNAPTEITSSNRTQNRPPPPPSYPSYQAYYDDDADSVPGIDQVPELEEDRPGL
ncbi:hypothetical protein B9479_007606 [Cryptococcus floricola]|uniref:Uncharacterized protein n=1 Tax=Cryptococcus floricola TaxID=2591691 RepID=A0A5D3ANV7_9TREE|nr:hypothetical protein B9479_007606 [Cryptococcus floricola]